MKVRLSAFSQKGIYQTNTTRIQALPTDMLIQIFSYLKLQALARCYRVSKPWRALIYDSTLWKVAICREIAFGEEKWSIHFGDVGVEPPLPDNIREILQSRCPFWPEKKVQDTHLLMLIPQTVNEKPLTLKSLGELVKAPKQGNKTQYSYFSLGNYTDPPAPASHWVLITRDVIPDSLNESNESYDDQKRLVASYARAIGLPYQVSSILDVVASIFIENVQFGNRLYSDNPLTYTRFQGLVAGGFSSAGLRVSGDAFSYYVRGRIGVSCARKL